MASTSATTPVPAPHDFRDHKQHMLWQMDKQKYEAATVPMIPQDMSQGSRSSSALTSSVMQKAVSNPFVPLGLLATVGCLVGMLGSTLKKNSHRAQLYMRGRCLAQGLTVVALVSGAFYYGGLNPDGSSPTPKRLPISVSPPKAAPQTQ